MNRESKWLNLCLFCRWSRVQICGRSRGLGRPGFQSAYGVWVQVCLTEGILNSAQCCVLLNAAAAFALAGHSLNNSVSDVFVGMEDHYQILGLPSGTEGAKLSAGEIRKAYRARALSCHPDKRPDDPLAAANFQKIQTSYEVLIDETARKALDDFLRLRQERLDREYDRDAEISSKRRKMMDDLHEREKAFDLKQQRYENDQAEEEKAAKKLQAEISRIRAMHAKKKFNYFSMSFKPPPKSEPAVHCSDGSDKEKMLKVTWNCLNGGGDYSADRLREIFVEFGTVEDIVIRRKGSKKKGTAIIVMASKSEVAAATQSPCGDLSNPLLVLPLLPSTNNSGYQHEESQADADDAEINNIVGAGYQAYEDSILKKLQKAAEKARLKQQGQQ